MDPATIMSLLQLAGSVAPLFGKKPKKPDFPEYQSISPEVRSKYLSGIESDITGQTKRSVDKLTTGLASRGLARGGLLPKLASDVTSAGNEQYSRAVTEFDLGESRRKNEWDRSRYLSEAGDYGEENQQYMNMLGGAGANIGNLLADPKFLQMLEGLFGGKGKRKIVPTQPGQLDLPATA